MAPAAEYAIRMCNITKTFGSAVANRGVNLELFHGEILALLGENGSGKTTLMNMLAGIYFPDSGQIFINGREVTITSPKEAWALGIGMVHQHFKLVDVFTAAENIVLGLPGGAHINRTVLAGKIRRIADKYGFVIDPGKKVYNMSVSEKQTVEIIKVLYRGADTLVLDEPTAVLTPQEADRLFDVLRKMKEGGKSVIIITHKLDEVLAVSDRVTVLRKGELVGSVNTCDAGIPLLTQAMVGRAVSLEIERPAPGKTAERLVVEHLCCHSGDGVKALDDVSFTLYGGEILGVAGVAGSGQRELCEALMGMHPVSEGAVTFVDGPKREDITHCNNTQRYKKGIKTAFVPEDRLGMGLVAGLDMVGNVMLKSYRDAKGFFVDLDAPRKLAQELIRSLKIVTPGINTPVSRLSGGNVQKVLLGREISLSPSVLVAAYPVRGLDINSSYTVYSLLNAEKQKGVAVLFVGEDLDVLLQLCDRILVLCGGRVSGILEAKGAQKSQIGLMMAQLQGAGGKERADEQ